MNAMTTLPEDGLNLRQELLAQHNCLVAQAMLRTNGDRAGAAKLLGTNALDLDRLRRVLGPVLVGVIGQPASARVPSPDVKQPAARASEEPTRTDLPRPSAETLAAVQARPMALEQGLSARLESERLERAERRAPPSTPLRVRLPRLPKLEPVDLGRIDGGVMKISRAIIRRLNTEGLTPRQIAGQLGVNSYFVEKVLRAEAELAKCGSKPNRE
jgi:hypothetical protein